MQVVCLDLGTRTGYAVLRDGVVISGTADFRPNRFEGGGMRYLRFRRWLLELIQELAGEVWYEECRAHAGTDAAHAYGGFLAILGACCEEAGIPYAGVPVGTIKRHATGKGNAGKQAVLASVRALGYNPCDDNEADAIALALYVRDVKRVGR